jgi:hypothetical protein
MLEVLLRLGEAAHHLRSVRGIDGGPQRGGVVAGEEPVPGELGPSRGRTAVHRLLFEDLAIAGVEGDAFPG